MILDVDGQWRAFHDENYSDTDRRFDTIDFDQALEEARSLRGEEDSDDTPHRDVLAYSDVVIQDPRVVFCHGRSHFPATVHDANNNKTANDPACARSAVLHHRQSRIAKKQTHTATRVSESELRKKKKQVDIDRTLAALSAT